MSLFLIYKYLHLDPSRASGAAQNSSALLMTRSGKSVPRGWSQGVVFRFMELLCVRAHATHIIHLSTFIPSSRLLQHPRQARQDSGRHGGVALGHDQVL